MIEQYKNTYKAIYNIIKLFNQKYRKKPLRMEVIKLIYLIDIEYYKKYGEKYSELNYIFYHHGPWDNAFHQLIDYMSGIEITEYKLQTQKGKDFFLYSATDKTPRNDIKLESDAQNALEDILFIYKYTQLSEMLKVVYTEEPMASTERGDQIDMSKLFLNSREKRAAYRKNRKNQIENIATLKNNMDKDDLELFAEFQTLRNRANSTI